MSQEQLWRRSPPGPQARSPLVTSASSASAGNTGLKLPRPSASEDCVNRKETKPLFTFCFCGLCHIEELGEMKRQTLKSDLGKPAEIIIKTWTTKAQHDNL